MKTLSRVLLAVYLLTLLWLVLFKFSYDLPAVLANYRTRSLNLVPFLGLSRAGLSETVSNCIAFVPFGLLLSVNFKHASRWRLLVVVLGFSLGSEILQYVFAIGATDATDVVSNTLGGLVGLGLYRLLDKLVRTEVVDRVIVAGGLSLFVAFVLLRLLVFQVRY